MTFLSALILLGILIFVHELGHFLFAKMMNVKVLKFSLGFGPKILGKRYGETEYLLSSIPLGGYVKMVGEDQLEEINEEDRARAFNFQPVWKRLLIVLSGPLFNILFAAIVFMCVFLTGVPSLLPEVGEVMPDSPAARSGMTKGDAIFEVEGIPIHRWDEMTEIIHKSPGKPLAIKIKRGSEVIALNVTPERKAMPNLFGEKKEVGLIGIKPSGNTFTEKESIGGAFGQAAKRTWDISVLTVVSVVKIIQRIIPADTIGGPILIFQMAGEQASQGPMNFFAFMAVISINLGIANLLPIPILDGGHVLFLGIEVIRRKPLSEKVVMIAQRVGLTILVAIMVLAFYNDIMRLIAGKTIP
ncbi:MAG TPA: RIP metalloprotease RseP [Thermodesulfovibrionales bacterium]|jgi:regulator of sigma E protease|nr:RIP metalloprotease RseP [Thermodesulfovibrionales bacterium]